MVVIVFVAAYLFREWVIQNTAVAAAAEAAAEVAAEAEVEPEASEQQNSNNSEHLAQQQATVDDIIHAVRSVNTTDQAVLNEREQISKRLEELRREIEQRRRITVVDTNNYVNNSNVITKSDNQNNDNDNDNDNDDNDNDDNDDDDDDDDEEEEDNNIYLNPPSGTQSPFASWRDYQQDNANSSLNHRNQQYTETTAASRSSTWRAREFSASSAVERSDYFAEQFLDETVLDEEEEEVEAEADNPPAIAAPPVVDPIAPNNNNEAPFDFGEDFDGILEAIGMHGNILMLVQNSILMSLMINLCLCVTVWIPYVIGRSVILVCMCFIHERILLLIIHI